MSTRRKREAPGWQRVWDRQSYRQSRRNKRGWDVITQSCLASMHPVQPPTNQRKSRTPISRSALSLAHTTVIRKCHATVAERKVPASSAENAHDLREHRSPRTVLWCGSCEGQQTRAKCDLIDSTMNHSNQSKISMHTSSWTPFDDPISKDPVQSQDIEHEDLIPASYRFGPFKDQVTVARPDLDFLETELSVDKLNFIHNWMWFVGRPMPPRPLHRQVLLTRSIIITEEMDLHLVWTARQKIYLKPIPRFLLSSDFWSSHILCPGTAQFQCANQDSEDCKQRQRLVGCALGFLFSYAALIAYESDYRIAQNEGLLPRELTWPAWRKFVIYLLENHTYSSINPRYHYGELRLGRLNKIYRYRYGHLWGYTGTNSYNLYAQFFQDNLANLAAFLGYVVIILTALQVGLATDQLQPSSAFQAFSYGFTIFSIVAPIFVTVAILIIFIVAYLVNCYITKSYHKKRSREIENSRLDGAKILE